MNRVKQGISVENGEFPIKGGKRSVKMPDTFFLQELFSF